MKMKNFYCEKKIILNKPTTDNDNDTDTFLFTIRRCRCRCRWSVPLWNMGNPFCRAQGADKCRGDEPIAFVLLFLPINHRPTKKWVVPLSPRWFQQGEEHFGWVGCVHGKTGNWRRFKNVFGEEHGIWEGREWILFKMEFFRLLKTISNFVFLKSLRKKKIDNFLVFLIIF